MIHVAYRLWGGDGFFAKMLGTSMLSMFENTEEKVTVHIMHNDRLTSDNRGKFCYIAGQYNQQIEFHNVEEISGATLRKFEAVHPIKSGINAAWYPLITHEVFPDLDKIIFLGADTVINLDIGELWAYDLGEYSFAAVPEALNKSPKKVLRMVLRNLVDYNDYFNVDVMIIRPSFFRENFETILEACKFVYNNDFNLNEQDALNYLFSKNYLKLPGEFNSMLVCLRDFTPKPHRLEKRIYHFSGWHRVFLDTDDIFNRLYFEYFLKTPWATADMFGNINKILEKTLGQVLNSSKASLLHFTNLLTERKRAFFVDKNFVADVKKIFKVKGNEPLLDSSAGYEKILKDLTNAKGKKVFFLLVNDYWQVRQSLLDKGFVEGTDFVNAAMFLPKKNEPMHFDTRPIVQEI